MKADFKVGDKVVYNTDLATQYKELNGRKATVSARLNQHFDKIHIYIKFNKQDNELGNKQLLVRKADIKPV